MSNIPDFVLQVKEIQRQLKTQMDITADDWRDKKREEYYQKYMDSYCERIDTYINGGNNMKGMGVNDLVVLCDTKLQDIEQLSGIPANVQFELAALGQHDGHLRDSYGNDMNVEDMDMIKNRDGIVHDERNVRDYWNNTPNDIGFNGRRPGELNQNDIKEIYNNNN